MVNICSTCGQVIRGSRKEKQKKCAERDKVILDLKAKGKSNDEISQELGVSKKTFYIFLSDAIQRENKKKAIISAEERELDTSVDYLGLSSRARNCLARAGLNFIGDIIELEQNDILKIRNAGENTLIEIQNAIKPFKLRE